MNLHNLEKALAGEPAYRLKQAKKAVFEQLISDWQEATIFPVALREKLNQECPLGIEAEIFPSGAGKAVKAQLTLKDGLKIETVLMRHKEERNTVCVSSAVGCPMGCLFCATGKLGLKRNLTADEIVEQVLFFSRYLAKEKDRVDNVVFMGMGEPFLNYDNVMKAIRIINSKEGFNIGARKISISTVGVTEGIRKLANENLQVNLAISLHAPNNKIRLKIIPTTKKYSIEKILTAVNEYIDKTNRKVMFEYLMINDLNDNEPAARELARLMKKPLYFVNLIMYNPTGVFSPSTEVRILRFKEILRKNRINFSERFRFGREVKAACGQLVADNRKK